MSRNTPNIAKESLEFIVNHVVLPPQLPQAKESSKITTTAENSLATLTLGCVKNLQAHCGSEHQGAWLDVSLMLSRVASMKAGDALPTKLIAEILGSMKERESLPLRIRAQNAALIFRHNGHAMSIECFELSPSAGEVLRCRGSLLRSFPAHAVAIPLNVVQSPSFLHELLKLLVTLDTEVVTQMMPSSTKAGDKKVEIRDEAHPGFVTEMIMAAVASVGTPVQALQIQKRYRDDALWDNALICWRRSTLWLMLKISIQTSLAHSLDATASCKQFKNFMVLMLSELLNLASESGLPVDLCRVIQIKLARRVWKLKTNISDHVQVQALETSRACSDKHYQVWQKVQKQDAERCTQIDLSTLKQDVVLTLTNCKKRLDAAVAPENGATQPLTTHLSQFSQWMSIGAHDVPCMKNVTSGEIIYSLAEVEVWVAQSLPGWVQSVVQSPRSEQCQIISELAKEYKDRAMSVYHGDSEQMSLMLLVMGELWSALDKICVAMIPLLAEYPPGISSKVFYPLLLPKKEQMMRLEQLERYLQARHTEADSNSASVFADVSAAGASCFAIRYYEHSNRHQALHQRIVEAANVRKLEKSDEWRQKQERYEQLTQEVAALECSTRINYQGDEEHDNNKCQKCSLIRKSSQLSIDIFEWPLPRDEKIRRLVVFELDCPIAFTAWRNLTWTMIHDLARGNETRGQKPEEKLPSYEGLRKFYVSNHSRITIASTSKPVARSHYKGIKFPCSFDQVLTNNGLQYQYFDSRRDLWIAKQNETASYEDKCRTILPEGPYKGLQYAVDSTSHTQNRVLAEQIECSSEISVHEFVAFCSLRADGEETQWPNISRELKSSNLSLNTEAVSTLIFQSAWQVGSPGTSKSRTSHYPLEDADFVKDLHYALSDLLGSIEANRQSEHTMSIIIVLLLRTLSITNSEEVAGNAIGLLYKCRLTTLAWARQFDDILGKISQVEQIPRIQRSLLRTAFLCKLTYDVESRYASRVMKTSTDVQCWTISSILAYNNTPGDPSLLPRGLQSLRLRDLKLTHSIDNRFHQLISTDAAKGLDRAVAEVWSGLTSSTAVWKSPSKTSHWITKQTAATTVGAVSQAVACNTLTGELLVDGRPLGRLPKEYTEHKLYTRVLGSQVLRVSTSDLPSMQYASSSEEFGHRLYFGKNNGIIIIRARHKSKLLELIPPECLEGDLPTIFVEDYVHWMNTVSGDIEFRPLDERWITKECNWILRYRGTLSSSFVNGETHLVDVRSPTCQSALKVFGGLEIASFMHITVSPEVPLKVTMPRLGLRFEINKKGQMECPELRKVVDTDQQLGTLIGLKSRLVLSAPGVESRKHDRMVLIPEGIVSASHCQGHVAITIKTTGRHVRCLRYSCNPILRRLESDSDLSTRLYQVYLHALTSNILPDPLSGLTGTEIARALLKDQLGVCFKSLDNSELTLLNQISALTPRRTFYPEHLQVMQRISWRKDISFSNQHEDFAILAGELIARANKFRFFSSHDEPFRALREPSNWDLLQRAKFQNSRFRSTDGGGNVDGSKFDKEYHSRDGISNIDRISRVFRIASLCAGWSNELNVSPYLRINFLDWGTIHGFQKTFSFSQSITSLLEFDCRVSWAPMYKFCRTASKDKDKYKLLFTFIQIAYTNKCDMSGVLETLLAFATLPALQSLPAFPNYPSFNLSAGQSPSTLSLKTVITSHSRPWKHSRANLTGPERKREHAEFQRAYVEKRDTAIRFYEEQWPCKEPVDLELSYNPWINVRTTHGAIRPLFATWYENRECESHIRKIQSILHDIPKPVHDFAYDAQVWQQSRMMPRGKAVSLLPTLPALMLNSSPPLIRPLDDISVDLSSECMNSSTSLRSLVERLISSQSVTVRDSTRPDYALDLQASLNAFESHREATLKSHLVFGMRDLLRHLRRCQEHAARQRKVFIDLLKPQNLLHEILDLSGLWPRLGVRNVLGNLRLASRKELSKPWIHTIILLAEGITVLQKATRLVLALEKGDSSGMSRELENEGHQGWRTHEWPDWLLIEIENNILIRPIQAKVAIEMVRPSTLGSKLMQLNMGEGKSSVIIPLIAAALADGKRLLRVIVLRTLTRQMLETVTSRLRGLASRPVFFMPFSRKTTVDEGIVSQLRTLQEECLNTHGILVAQPEHVLSFQLAGIERLTTGNPLGMKMLGVQQWLDENARDVLDESDEILDVKFQLIYTLGAQRNMDGQPDRWLLIQSIFDLVEYHAYRLQIAEPKQFEVEKRGAGFPTIRLLSQKASSKLLAKVLYSICEGKLPLLSFDNLSSRVRRAAINLLREDLPIEQDCDTILTYSTKDGNYLKKLLIVRGMLSGGVLHHVLTGKRWSVNYGLSLSRCLCAVPYRAKGVPAPTAEFGHPDVTISLTCLSYYYTGLSEGQLRQCFEILQKSEDPSFEYSAWSGADPLYPEKLRSWNAVNLEDERQFQDLLLPALQYNKKTVDFFLKNVVFPQECKEFDHKLSSSGWDIPAPPGSKQLTTGFSGTNDNRFLLPFTIIQQDLPELKHTSGKVLSYVTRPENLQYFCAKNRKGHKLSSTGLLKAVVHYDANVRVIIDVGAQILDLSNLEVVVKWMSVIPAAQAGVFFDAEDRAMVCTRDNRIEKLSGSSFLGRMDQCVVYLDEAHTRGTDLKLPDNVRAAVTLGPRLTKDRLVQACMRLRQLGKGHSLLFVAPPEVHSDIIRVSRCTNPSTPDPSRMDGYHVIQWALEQSCLQIERNRSLWALQGLNFYTRVAIMDQFQKSCSSTNQQATPAKLQEAASNFIEMEHQSLNDLYAPLALHGENTPNSLIDMNRSNTNPQVKKLIKIWDQIDPNSSRTASVHEEHEREVAHEVESEIQIERPPKATPYNRAVDLRIKAFILYASEENLRVFPTTAILKHTSITQAKTNNPPLFWNHLHVSTDFAQTVQHDILDQYLRPVHWILVPKTLPIESLLLISQYEANQLMHDILSPSSSVLLLNYEPRVTRSMLSVEASSYPSTPLEKEAWGRFTPELMLELHLFAGQLYLNTYEDYMLLVRELGDAKSEVAPTVGMVKEWMGMRRKGHNYLQTHIGQVVSGRGVARAMFD